MNDSTLTQLKVLVERAVRPVRASSSRKRKMREELLAHVSAVFKEEAARLHDEQAALEGTAMRFGNPTELTIQEFAEKVCAHFPNSPKIIYEPLPVDDPKQRRPDISKARRLLGWEPQVGLDEGLKRTIDFFKQEYAKVWAAR